MALLTKILLGIIVILSLLLGWNWWRKEVYYLALKTVAAQKVAQARAAEQQLAKDIAQLTTQAEKDKAALRQGYEKQLEDLVRPVGERVVYKLRDRWLPATCPAAAGPGEAVGGLSPADELFLVRFARVRDERTIDLNTCIDAYNAVRQQAVDANK